MLTKAMPYISKKQRKALDSHIDALAETIANGTRELGDNTAFAGMLNYVCTRLGLKIVNLLFKKPRYWIIAMLTGVFQNVSEEFYRRVAAPYEDEKIRDEGDVDAISSFISK